MKVLHVTEAYGAGVQAAISHFTTAIPSIDHVVLGRIRKGENSAPLSSAQFYPFEGTFVAFAAEFRKAVKALQPDAIHFHSSFAGLLRGLPVGTARAVYSPHCYAFERTDIPSYLRKLYRIAESALGRRTASVVAVSPHEGRLAQELRSSYAVHVVTNFAPTSASAIQIRTPSARRIITVGRVSAQKDPALFAAAVRRSDPSMTFTWVGDGDARLRDELEASGVRVTGWLSPERIRSELLEADLYLHTAAWEASPLSIVEALESGLPILCSDLPTLRSLGYPTVDRGPARVAGAISEFFFDLSAQQSIIERSQQALQRAPTWDTPRQLLNAYTGTKALD